MHVNTLLRAKTLGPLPAHRWFTGCVFWMPPFAAKKIETPLNLIIAIAALLGSAVAFIIGQSFLFEQSNDGYLRLFGLLVLGMALVGVFFAFAVLVGTGGVSRTRTLLSFKAALAIAAAGALYKYFFGGVGF